MNRMVLVLTAVMVLSGLVLAAVSGALTPRIEENQRQALAHSLASIFDDAQSPEFAPVDAGERPVWRATDGGRSLGYAVRVEATGYGGPIQLLVGIDPGLSRILGIAVVQSVETPGLGARIQEEPFQGQFEGLSAEESITAVKNQPPDPSENEIQAISGATISTNAVVNAVNAALPEVVDGISRQERDG